MGCSVAFDSVMENAFELQNSTQYVVVDEEEGEASGARLEQTLPTAFPALSCADFGIRPNA